MKNSAVINTKPKTQIEREFGTEQLYTVVFQAKQPMGLLLALTYTSAGTVQSAKTR